MSDGALDSYYSNCVVLVMEQFCTFKTEQSMALILIIMKNKWIPIKQNNARKSVEVAHNTHNLVHSIGCVCNIITFNIE